MIMKKIIGTDDAWDARALGAEDAYVKKSEFNELTLDEAAGLKAISIRMQNSLIDDLKLIAKINGLGYQPLIKQVLQRFVDAEKKQLLKAAASAVEEEHESHADTEDKYAVA